MSIGHNEDDVIQLKINYIKLMEQYPIFPDLKSKQRGILHALLIEKDYLTQEQLMVLTGYSRKVVSETLTELTEDVTIKYPVLKTRRPGDTKNYYFCPLNFEQIVRSLLISYLKTSRDIHFFPDLVERLKALTPHDDDISHFRSVLSFYLIVNEYLRIFMEKTTEENIIKYFKNPTIKPEFLESIQDFLPTTEVEKARKTQITVEKTKDTLQQIRRDLISKMQEYIGGKKETIIAMLLYLERKAVNQDYMMRITGYGRSTISESLTVLKKAKIVKEIKKPGDRKKYYKPALSLTEFTFLRIIKSQQTVYQLKEIIKTKFLSDLENLEDNEVEKNKLRYFLKENIRSYELLLSYLNYVYSFFSEIKDKINLNS
ncbi:MAG: hypothetical protein ACFFDI_20710 [Promethearchaeota archaeon]